MKKKKKKKKQFSMSAANPRSQFRLELKIPKNIPMRDIEALLPFAALDVEIIYSCYCYGHSMFDKLSIPLQGTKYVVLLFLLMFPPLHNMKIITQSKKK